MAETECQSLPRDPGLGAGCFPSLSPRRTRARAAAWRPGSAAVGLGMNSWSSCVGKLSEHLKAFRDLENFHPVGVWVKLYAKSAKWISEVDATQSGLSVSYPARHSSTSGFKSHQTAGILSFRLQNRPGYVQNVLIALWLRHKCYFMVAEAKLRCLGGRRRSLFSPRDSHLVPEMFSPKNLLLQSSGLELH